MGLLLGLGGVSTSTLIVVGFGWGVFTLFLYRIFFHPLRSVPGPLVAKVTSLWLYYHSWKGDEATQITKLQDKYGSVVRIAPNEVDINDGEALAPIYSTKGGFPKADCYWNFDFEGHHTIFSATDVDHRKGRAKAVAGLFANSRIYAEGNLLHDAADAFVARLKEEACKDEPVNVLNFTRCLALDSLSSYLFGKSYGALAERSETFSASKFVYTFVAVGRFFYLPGWVFALVEKATSMLFQDDETNRSFASVDDYADRLVNGSGDKGDTYQARLLNAGFSKHEVKVQCEDVMFAGTDSTGTTLATILWNLAASPDAYDRLRQELHENDVAPELLQTLPYLRGVINEGLRLGLPNPTRLPRTVPPGGWHFGGHFFPGGTIVGVGTWQLFLKQEVFHEPGSFDPGRWLKATPEMQRDFIPFSLGPRQCIARNLAMAELFITVANLVRSDVLKGAKRVNNRIEILQWFNSKVTDEKIELVWAK